MPRCDNPMETRPSPSSARSILANEKNNAKFNFLTPGDPYHAYYQHKARRADASPSSPADTSLWQVSSFRLEDAGAKPAGEVRG